MIIYQIKFHPWVQIISGGVAETKEAEDLRKKEEEDKKNKHCEILVSCSDEERNCLQAQGTACKLM